MKPNCKIPSSTVAWISPLQERHRPSTSPPPSSESSSPMRRKTMFVPHAEAIRLMNKSETPNQLLSLFNSLPLHPAFSHTPATYSALLLKLARFRQLPTVLSLLRHHLPLQPLPLEETLLLSLMPYFHPDHIVTLFTLIHPLTRRPPSLSALSRALNLLVDASRFDLARSVLLHSRSHVITPNACIYNILIKHCCKHANRLASALKILDIMRHSSSSSSTKPNLITYSTLIGGLCRQGRLKDAFQLFEEMIERDRIVPDALTYNLLIDGFCRQGEVDKARAVLEFMSRNGCEPNVVNYSALMGGFCRAGKVDEARAVFAEMRERNLAVDAVAYTAIVSCLCKGGRVDEGIELVREMGEGEGEGDVRVRVRADIVTYNVVIGGLCRVGRAEEAMGMLERLALEGVKLNVASYRMVMNSLVGSGEMERAVALLGLMLGRGFKPHFAASNQLLRGLCERGKVADAAVALYGLAQMGFCPEIASWESLVESVCRERKLRTALHLLDQHTH